MKLTVAHTNDPDTDAAAHDLVEQARAKLGDAQPVAGILFAAVDAEHEPLLAAIMDAFPGLALIGCTTDGEVSSALKFQEDSMGSRCSRATGYELAPGSEPRWPPTRPKRQTQRSRRRCSTGRRRGCASPFPRA